MSWKGFLLRAGITSDGKNIAFKKGNLTVQDAILPKGIVPSEVVTAGPTTYTIAQLLTGFILRDPTGTSRADLLPTAALIIAGIKGVFVGLTFEFIINNTGSNGEIITVTTATGLTLTGIMTIDGGELRRFRVEVTGVTTPAVVIRDSGSGNGLSASEMEFLDGAIAGTQVANKAVIADANVNTGVSKVTALSIGSTGAEVVQEPQLVAPTLTTVDDTAVYAVGREYTNPAGEVFIYLQGIASVIEGDWVTYRVTSITTAVIKRVVAGDQGTLAIAMAAVINTKFGWFQVVGNNLAAGAITGGDAAVGGAVFLTATPGIMDDVEVSDDRVSGAVFSVQEGELSGNPAALAGATISRPFVGMGWPVRPILSQIDDSALYSVGRKYEDVVSGDVWVYLSGVASCVEGSWLTYYITSTAAAVTALLAASALGLVAIAVGALENTKFGWAQIAGNNLRAKATSGGDAAAGAHVYYQAAGIVDDQIVAGDMVYGAIFSIQEGELSGNPAGLAGVTIAYPFVTNEST